MFDVLGIGVAAVDDLVWVAAFPAPDTKVRILRSVRDCGGLSATALVAASRLGARCAYAGVLGPDDLSDYVLHALAAAGVDTSHVDRRPDAAPAHSIVVIDETSGSRTVLSDSSGARTPAADWPPESVLAGTRVLLVDHVRMDAAVRAARVARAAEIPVVADLERDDPPHFAELLSLVDHLVISRAFAARLTGVDDPERTVAALAAPHRSVVVTSGANGCWYAEPGESAAHQPAFEVDVVDTTGCGDVFHGAYAAGLAEAVDLPARVRLASAAAALAATQPGGQAGIPDRAAVEALLAAAIRTAGGA